jgi:hypothetical protein
MACGFKVTDEGRGLASLRRAFRFGARFVSARPAPIGPGGAMAARRATREPHWRSRTGNDGFRPCEAVAGKRPRWIRARGPGGPGCASRGNGRARLISLERGRYLQPLRRKRVAALIAKRARSRFRAHRVRGIGVLVHDSAPFGKISDTTSRRAAAAVLCLSKWL